MRTDTGSNRRQEHRSAKRLYAVPFLTDFAALLLIFTVSRELAEQGAGLARMGFVGGILSVFSAISSLFCGWISDRIGRRRLILGGTGLLALSALGCLLVPSVSPPYFGAYWLGGISFGMIYPALIAWLNQDQDTSGGATISRNLIFFCLSWNVGLVVGQVSGGWLFRFNHAWPLALSVLLSVVNFAVVYFVPRRVPGTASAPVRVASESSTAAGQAVAGAFATLGWIANLASAFCISMVLHLFPELVVSLGIRSDHHGVMLGLMRVLVIAVYLIMHHSRFWQFRYSSALVAQVVAMAGLAMLIVARSPAGLLAGLAGVGVLTGYNYFASLYYSSMSREDDRRGFASGMHEATLTAGIAIGSIAGGLIGSVAGSRAPYGLALGVVFALTLIQAGIYVRCVRPRARVYLAARQSATQ